MATNRRRRGAPRPEHELVAEAKDFLSEREGAESRNREAFVEDLRFAFVPGEQWDEMARQRRLGRPCYSYNRVVGAINQVVGDQRLVRPTGTVRAVNNREKVGVALTLAGLIRDIEAQSNAEDIYDHAFKFSVAGGWSAWRVVPEYADDVSFDQVLRIRRIRNPLTTYFDAQADEFGRGAQRVVIADRISRSEYEAKYGEDRASSLQMPRDWGGWVDKNEVRVGEFYKVTYREKRLALLSDGRVFEAGDALKAELERARANGILDLTVLQERTVKQPIIVWAKIDALHLLEGPIEYEYRHIPVVRLPGRYINIEGEELFQGLIAHAKDPQRTYNYDRSAMLETVALSPRAPFVGTAKMFKNYEDMWRQANVRNYAYLPFDPDPDAPQMKPERQPGPEVPAAFMALAQHDAEDIRHTTGHINPAVEQPTRAGDAESGRALFGRLMVGNSESYEFLDNLGKAIKFTHEIIISMIPVHMTTERIVRILGPDDRENFVRFDPAELRDAKFDVTVTLGPSYATTRMEALDRLLEASERMPIIAEEAPDIIVRNMDVDGADEIERRIRRRLILEGRIQPTPQEAEEMGPAPPPDPTQAALRARLEAQAQRDAAAAQKYEAEAAARLAEARNAERREAAELALVLEEIRNLRAETAKLISEARAPRIPDATR